MMKVGEKMVPVFAERQSRRGRKMHRSFSLVLATLVWSATLAGEQITLERQIARRSAEATVLRGRVLAADTGKPLRRVTVSVLGGPTLIALTDADGRYEFKEVSPGGYVVRAGDKAGYLSRWHGQTRSFERGKPIDVVKGRATEINFMLPPGAVIYGRIVDEFDEPVENVQVSAMRFQFREGRRVLVPAGDLAGTTNDLGEYRLSGLQPGQYYVLATPRIAIETAPHVRSGYVPVFFPGTPKSSEAQPVAVGVGGTASNTDIRLLPTATVSVSGTVIAPGPIGVAGQVGLMPRPSEIGAGSSVGGTLQRDGTFVIRNVLPGDYTIRATTGPVRDGDPAFATAVIIAGTDDLSDVELHSRPAASVTGRIIADRLSRPVPTELRVTLIPAEPDDGLRVVRGRVNADFTFDVKAPPGRYLLRVAGQPGWILRDVTWKGHDVTDDGIDIKQQDLAVQDVEVEMTDQSAQISGVVTDANGMSVSDYSVIIFAQNRNKWVHMSRFIVATRPNQNGRFEVVSLPEGPYFIVALDYLETGAETDPELLERLRLRATSVTLGAGERRSVALSLMPN